MKHLAIVAILLVWGGVYAKSWITGFEYWFNTILSGRQVQFFNPAAQIHFQVSFTTRNLENGLNILHLRFKNDNFRYSSTLGILKPMNRGR